ncbi:MAG: metallophosphoesterase family protein [Chloroflexota bacterium]
MKILAVSDQIVERIYSLIASDHFRGVNLLLGCGDLPYSYLENIVTLLNVPLYYVPGNHDPAHDERLAAARAEGGVNLDLKTVSVKGLLLGGFGGCARYRPDGVNQYTQSEAYARAFRLLPRLWWNRLRHGRALDVLISHAPPFGIHDDETQAHRGLRALNWLLRVARPRYHLHGHTHFQRQNLSASTTRCGSTEVVNIFPYKTIEIQDV